MKEAIYIDSEGFEGSEDEIDGLKEFFAAKVHHNAKEDEFDGKLRQALDLVVNDMDERAVLDDVEVTEVVFDAEAKTVEVFYSVTFSAYYGCRDQNYTSSDERSVVGSLEDGYWVFDSFIPTQRLSPSEEL